MILAITSRCTMGCSHCLNDCLPEGVDMSQEKFNQFLKMIKETGTMAPILVSGGEPTLHPNWFEMVKTLLDNGFYTMLLSNGLFVDNDEQVEKLKILKSYKFFKEQITHDAQYYPIPINYKKIKELNLILEKQIRAVSSEGRAKKNGIQSTKTYSACINPRSFKIQRPEIKFWGLVGLMTQAERFCFPLITPTGDIKSGESFFCKTIGNIYDSEEKLTDGLSNLSCNTCGLINNPITVLKTMNKL